LQLATLHADHAGSTTPLSHNTSAFRTRVRTEKESTATH